MAITIPDFYCPVDPALNPHADEGDRFAIEWASRLGLIADEDVWGIGPAHLGHLAGYSHPDVSLPALRIAIAWLDWLMVYDDGVLDKYARVSKLDQPTITAFQDRILGILRGESDGDQDDPLDRGMHAIRSDIVRLAPDWEMTSFVRGFARYLQSNVWEATNIWRREPPGLSVYTNMRRHTGCLFPTYELSAVLGGIRLPAATREHVALRQLEIMANNYTCWLNDVFSFEREQVDGQVNNLVAVLRHEFDLDYQEAADRAVVMCRVEMDSYLELKDRLPSLGLDMDDELTSAYVAVISPPMTTISQPRCRDGTVSAIMVNATGSMPPAPMPIRKHMTRFHSYDGIVPQIAVAMNSWPARMIDALRPIRSPNQPHRNDPMTVPVIPASGSRATGSPPCGFAADVSPYSLAMPGATNASVMGFMASMTTASASTTISRTAAGFSRVSLPTATRVVGRGGCPSRRFGTMPNALAASPLRISTMPSVMTASGCMPAIL